MIDIGKSQNKIFSIDLPTLIETRLILQAQSGAGKSWMIRRLLEQSYGKLPHTIFDIEGEFSTLRNIFPYVVAGKGRDIPADPKTAKLLARKLLELKASCIIDLYELKAHDRIRFVRYYLESLIEAPKKLRYPILVVLDEAHHFCPEKGQAESAAAVIDLCTRGRKRGLVAILATQRLSKLHKDAAAECGNKMIGRTTQDIDRKRACDELGYMTKQDSLGLRDLKPGQFYFYGPAGRIGNKNINSIPLITVGSVKSHHPKIGTKQIDSAPPPKGKIIEIISKLADIPAEVEKKAKELSDYKKDNIQLKREITSFKKSKPVTMIDCNHEPIIENLNDVIKNYDLLLDDIKENLKNVGIDIGNITKKIHPIKPSVITKKQVKSVVCQPAPKIHNKITSPVNESSNGDISAPQFKILNSLVSFEGIGVTSVSKIALAIYSGVSPKSSGYISNLSKLRIGGFIDYKDKKVILINAGREIAEDQNPINNLNEYHTAWERMISNPQASILKELIKIYPEDYSKDELANILNVSYKSSGYISNLSKLRILGAIDYLGYGRVVATDLMFPEGLV